MPYAPSATGGIIGGASVSSGTNNLCNSGGCAGPDSSSSSSPEDPITNGTSISVISSPNGFSPDQISPPSAATSSRPPLPPPPRQSHCVHGRPYLGAAVARNGAVPSVNGDSTPLDQNRPWWRSWNRKYVLLCGTCGLSSVLLGTFYLIIYFVLRSYTSSLEFFQTMPTYIPACALIVTGLLVLCFMKRKNRLSILIKIVGFLCLVCAVVCVVVTVTTTVLHMNRLQTLRECTFYTQLHSCTCLPFTDEEPFELKLDINITTCDVIHGPLYSCLRAMFGVSVIGILVSIFSCMLVYQLLSHEKKKMYWEQLENRRRMLFRRAPAPTANCNNCCDEYGFVPSSELYPWGGMWDAVDDRYWSGGAQLYSPGAGGEDSSNASRSVLLGGANPNGAPSIWLPWGGAWGAAGVQAHLQGVHRDPSTPAESAAAQTDQENMQNEEIRPQSTGVLLRPFLPRGIEARFGLRRQPPPPPGSHSRRPLSDPGVALQLPRYPPPFSEGFLPPIPYEGLEAFSRLMWDPPPPYSQPASAENLTILNSIATSPLHDIHRTFNVISTPSRRPTTLVDLIRGPASSSIPSPNGIGEMPGNHSHFTIAKGEDSGIIGGTGSLPLNHRLRRLPLGHVKSLEDVTEATRESLEILFCDGNEITSLDKFALRGDVLQKFPSHDDVTPRLFALKARHLKSLSDPKVVYAKGEQESELYFADVSSCVSIRADADDGEDTLYYSEPASQKTSPEHSNCADATTACHLYEQVRHFEDEEEDDAQSHHTSDDTMIVHTSSSDHSLGIDTENTYSVVSPLTDQSSASPMVTDTDAYSCYQVVTSPSYMKSQSEATGNLNLHPHHMLQIVPPHHHHLSFHSNHPHLIFNDNDLAKDEEPRYEMIQGEETSVQLHGEFGTSSDMNGNVALSAGQRETPDIRQAQRTNLTLPLRRIVPSSNSVEEADQKSPEGKKKESSSRARKHGKSRKKEFQERSSTPFHNHSSEPNTPTDRRLQSVQDHLFTLKSVNV